MSATKLFYAVRKGKMPGIYHTWESCKEQVSGFSNAEYKKFDNLKDAKTYLKTNDSRVSSGFSLYIDGGSRKNPGVAGCAAVLFKDNARIAASYKYLGAYVTNNEAEYQSLILGLNVALSEGVSELKAFSDSKLIVCQVQDKWNVNHPELIRLNLVAKGLVKTFKKFDIQHISRELNVEADELANHAMDLGEQFNRI